MQPTFFLVKMKDLQAHVYPNVLQPRTSESICRRISAIGDKYDKISFPPLFKLKAYIQYWNFEDYNKAVVCWRDALKLQLWIEQLQRMFHWLVFFIVSWTYCERTRKQPFAVTRVIGYCIRTVTMILTFKDGETFYYCSGWQSLSVWIEGNSNWHYRSCSK